MSPGAPGAQQQPLVPGVPPTTGHCHTSAAGIKYPCPFELCPLRLNAVLLEVKLTEQSSKDKDAADRKPDLHFSIAVQDRTNAALALLFSLPTAAQRQRKQHGQLWPLALHTAMHVKMLPELYIPPNRELPLLELD